MFFLYNLLLLLLTPLALLALAWRALARGKSRQGVRERLGLLPLSPPAANAPRVWLHAVSVGETVAAAPIWPALLQALPGWELIHSTTTETGQGQARRLVGTQGRVIYFPFEWWPCVALALARVRPELVVLVETELWPNFLAVAHRRGAKVMLVNGRISDRSLRGARIAGPLYRWMLRHVDRFCMQSSEDAARIIALGADPSRVAVVGNSKFDQVSANVTLGEQMTLRQALGLERSEPVLLAGSTHPGEEELILRAFRQVKSAHPTARLIIAPRQITRAQEIEEHVLAHGFTCVRRSKQPTGQVLPEAIILLDTIGELARAYALCVSAFVGGSFVPVGGHNILEPLIFGKPTLFGPHMHNFRDISRIALEAGVGCQVTEADELAREWSTLLAAPEKLHEVATRTARIFAAHQGASARCAAEARALVDGAPTPSGVETA
jgi:3-deoxy-D-manno-octulosonic-acid transferase